MGKHEGKTNGVEENPAKAGVYYAFHEHVARLTGAAETSFQHGEADLHAKHQEGGDKGPSSVNRIDDVGRLYFGSASLGINVTKEKTRDNCDDEQDQTDAHCFSAEEKPPVAAPFGIPQPRR